MHNPHLTDGSYALPPPEGRIYINYWGIFLLGRCVYSLPAKQCIQPLILSEWTRGYLFYTLYKCVNNAMLFIVLFQLSQL